MKSYESLLEKLQAMVESEMKIKKVENCDTIIRNLMKKTD
jgi:hypothetical protein